MTYHAKKPRKKQLRIKIEKCYYVSLVDETETEIENDYCFGTRSDAEQCGKKLKEAYQNILDMDPELAGKNPAELIFWGMNENGGS